ncbi:MAG TPA: cytochrome c oxidase assembly protein [Dokdonella sp.]|uniref:cytochrome c oxidase assembly protein n=1 Tax=Dokdonella sp. TaxID=2291710 RepID=UPI002D7F0E26|nr:cytochrome c oxidase assembly protein [Dokdonella sp.]HET9032079.1 cytochrome c oxidase assembly protein [Dokdonella sp.]
MNDESSTTTPRKPAKHDARGIAKVALGVVVASFFFGFAMVPIYRIACEHVLGIRMSGEAADAAQVAMMTEDKSRTVAVEFVANVNSKLPWSFKAEKARIEIHPGALTEVWFDATNVSDAAIVGNAVPSVAPAEASPFFNKTECFCFTEQTLEAGESRRMPVRFVVDPQLPQKTKTLTLSYTFYANELATKQLSLVPAPVVGIASN